MIRRALILNRAVAESSRLRSPPFCQSAASLGSYSRSSAASDSDEDFVVPKAAASSVSAAPNLLQPRVLIYDGVCHLCHSGVKWVIKTDKYEKIKFCCVQSRAAEPYLGLVGLEREDVLRRVLFIEGLHQYFQGSAAALKVASYLPFPYSALSHLMIIPTPVRDAVYDYVAKNRYDWFGKDDKCIVMQDKKLLDRFIDRDELLGGRSGTQFF
ncbi:hypothetical protein LUZ60_000317 [Juncus effusus]|nr:hypothetical protein LUZ60_000317 [Juncus effusus]